MSNPIFEKRHRKIQEYLQMIEAVSASTDDYLYLVESDTGLVHFTNQIHLKYQLPDGGKKGFPVEDWVKTIYPQRRGSCHGGSSAVSLTAHRKSTTWSTACLTAKATAAGSAAAARFRMTRTDASDAARPRFRHRTRAENRRADRIL